MWDFPFFPEQASTFAQRVDLLYFVLVGLSLLFAGILPFVMLYLIVKYHRSMKANRQNPVNSSLSLELTWSIIPLVLALVVFFWSAWLYLDMTRPPPDTLEVYVIGKQWMWHAQHPSGKRENNELHVPVGQPVKLIMTSQDVIHSFYIPAFRVKQDVVPGRYTVMWFEATKEGEYHLFCAEYCGTEHSRMVGRVVAMSLADYQRWLTAETDVIGPAAAGQDTPVQLEPMALAGQQIFAQQGCASCHRLETNVRAPVLEKLYGSTVRLDTGETFIADENYIRQSILDPASQVVAGFEPIMPTYEDQLTEDQLLQLIAYIKAIGNPDGSTP
ncbi:MAG: cytochrome c oxidase subunit II [Chloroflexales bacterium]|nr:cytochrome c oxidase subunit II [Chloroflexales bacterium]